MNTEYDWTRFREISYSGEALYKCDLKIDGEQVPASQIAKITISNPIIDTQNPIFYVGSFISQQLTIKFKNLDGLNIQSNLNVTLDIGLNVDGEIKWISIGKFLIDTLAENYQTTCEIVCLDYAVKMKQPVNYKPVFVDDKATIDDILVWICQFCGVELGTYPTINGEIEIGTYDETVSGKQWISYIAELKGCNAKFDGNGVLHLISLKSSPSVEINALKSKSWVLGEKYEITAVTYFDATRNFSFGVGSENALVIRQDNPFILDATTVENIYNELLGTVIWNLTTENYADISLLPYMYIDYVLGDRHYQTLHNATLTYEMNIMSKVDVKIPSKQQQITTNNLGVNINDIKKIQSTVDLINGEIEILATDTQTNAQMINQNYETINNKLEQDYYNTQQVEQLIVNAKDGLTNTYTQSGGNNILRNTTFSANDVLEENQIVEYWFGNLVRDTNNNAVNGFSIYLQQGSLYQEQSVANGEYTLSFNYDNKNALATSKVIVNGKEYLLSNSGLNYFQTGLKDADGNYITDPIVVTDNRLRIEFITDLNNSCEIYDIMCNIGNVKSVYSQNENETTTDTVNISKGISIISSESDVKFTANNDGIRTRNKKTNDVITDFTDKGMTTNEAVVKNEAEIVGILRQKVGDQIWDSLI